jgi:ParB family transcriptional regulator, chromosome partitioning protein
MAVPTADRASVQRLPVDRIRRSPFQPRRDFPSVELDTLAESLKRHGMLQPIVVRPTVEGDFELVAGERRWRAAQRAGWQDIPAAVRQLNDAQAAELALVENLQRQNLGPIELAHAIARLVAQFGLTHEEVAATLGAERSTVTNSLRLLELDSQVQALIGNAEGQLRAGHAKVLAGLAAPAQRLWARRVLAEGLSVRQLESALARSATRLVPPGDQRDADVDRLERMLSEHLGAPVRIDHARSGAGQVLIRYGSLDELQGLLDRMGHREG